MSYGMFFVIKVVACVGFFMLCMLLAAIAD